MDKQEYLISVKDVIYLCKCAINEVSPDLSKVKTENLQHLYEAAESHMLTAITAMALESAGVKDYDFTQAKGKAFRKNAALDVDKRLLFQLLDSEGVWYMPLKGAVLKDCYPKYGMRQMSDFDILFDEQHAKRVKEIMVQLGFEIQHVGVGHHDSYTKKPVSNFEMHTMLFAPEHNEKMYVYYKDIKSRLIKDQENRFGYHFSNEDFYIFMLAHEYKHYSNGGTGLRSLLDIYVFMQKFGSSLDMDYLERELEKLGISDFEKQSRQLALKLFNGSSLTAEDKEMLEYMILSGTFGNMENSVKYNVKKYGGGLSGKLKYLFRRTFPPIIKLQEAYPFFYKHKILIPFLTIYRICKGLTTKRHETKAAIGILLNETE